jgi:hypothetical protein
MKRCRLCIGLSGRSPPLTASLPFCQLRSSLHVSDTHDCAGYNVTDFKASAFGRSSATQPLRMFRGCGNYVIASTIKSGEARSRRL